MSRLENLNRVYKVTLIRKHGLIELIDERATAG